MGETEKRKKRGRVREEGKGEKRWTKRRREIEI